MFENPQLAAERCLGRRQGKLDRSDCGEYRQACRADAEALKRGTTLRPIRIGLGAKKYRSFPSNRRASFSGAASLLLIVLIAVITLDYANGVGAIRPTTHLIAELLRERRLPCRVRPVFGDAAQIRNDAP